MREKFSVTLSKGEKGHLSRNFDLYQSDLKACPCEEMLQRLHRVAKTINQPHHAVGMLRLGSQRQIQLA